MKKQEENIFDTTTKIRIIKEEIAYARSQLQPHDTGHIHTAIGWMESRVGKLKLELKEQLDGKKTGDDD